MFKGIGKFFKKALPYAAAAAGTYFGGPQGGLAAYQATGGSMPGGRSSAPASGGFWPQDLGGWLRVGGQVLGGISGAQQAFGVGQGSRASSLPQGDKLGHQARMYMDNAFPGTTPWERLGGGGGGSATPIGGAQSAGATRDSARMQLANTAIMAKAQVDSAKISGDALVRSKGVKPETEIELDRQMIAANKKYLEDRLAAHIQQIRSEAQLARDRGGEAQAGAALKREQRDAEHYRATAGRVLSLMATGNEAAITNADYIALGVQGLGELKSLIAAWIGGRAVGRGLGNKRKSSAPAKPPNHIPPSMKNTPAMKVR